MTLDSLKVQSDDAFAFAAQARVSLPNVEDLRITVEDTIKSAFSFCAVRYINYSLL